MPADDDHDDEEDAGDRDGDEEHNESRHTGEGSRKSKSCLSARHSQPGQNMPCFS